MTNCKFLFEIGEWKMSEIERFYCFVLTLQKVDILPLIVLLETMQCVLQTVDR